MVRKVRTTLTVPAGLIDRAREAGLSNISQFCAQALQAYLDGVRDAKEVAARLHEESSALAELSDEEISQAIDEYVSDHREQILKHLVQHGTVGRKAFEQIRSEILLNTGKSVPPAAIRSALVDLRTSAWESGDLHAIKASLLFDREYKRYASKIRDYIESSYSRRAMAVRVKEENDPGLTSIWASEIVDYFADRGITIHTPTVVRVLETIPTDHNPVTGQESTA
ncbi:MAG: type II toxin-antitoxin system CcdA family antitoxin [Methanoculleus sp.]